VVGLDPPPTDPVLNPFGFYKEFIAGRGPRFSSDSAIRTRLTYVTSSLMSSSEFYWVNSVQRHPNTVQKHSSSSESRSELV